jgi:dimethylargininase
VFAYTRAVSPSIADCELSHLERVPIDPGRAAAQHQRYEAALASLGCEVRRIPPEPHLPDAVFVEDAAVVFDEVAIIARPGADSRRPEVDSVAAILAQHRPLRFIEPPATLDGGDVLVLGSTVLVGASGRTDARGAAQLRAILDPLGYEVQRVAVEGCLHLKSALTAVSEEAVVLNPARVDPGVVPGHLVRIEVDPTEPNAANALPVGHGVLVAAGHEGTAARLEAHGLRVVAVDVSELAKAEAGVTCCCVLVR